MMKFKIEASTLFTTLILIISILLLVFLGREKWLIQERLSNEYYKSYLSRKIALKSQLKQGSRCKELKQPEIKIQISELIYTYQCEMKSLFIKPKPTKDKYIAFTQIDEWLALDNVEVYEINSLKDLPKSSEQDPKIVFAKNDIDEKLEVNFYGIIITNYYFDITGSKKMYGVLYSSFDNLREERNLTFSRKVVDNLEKKYAVWYEIPQTRNILNSE